MGKMKGKLAPSPKDKFLKIPLHWAVRGGVLPRRLIALGGPTESQMQRIQRCPQT